MGSCVEWGEQSAARRLIRGTAGIDLLAPKVCRLDHPRECPAEPGGDRVAMAQLGPAHHELRLRAPEDEIGVVARGDGALAPAKADQTGGATAEPRRQGGRRVPP